MKIKLTDIAIDDAIYPRSKVYDYNVQRMVLAYDSGAKFPPLIIEAVSRRLIDGRHRYETYKRKGTETVNVIEKIYASEADLFADAVRLNIEHGQPLDQFSVRTSIAKLIELGLDRSAIGEIVRIPPDTIDNIVKGFAETNAGQAVALKGGLRHMQGQTLTPRQIEVNRSYAGGKASFYAKQIADLLEADLWPRNSPAFLEQMSRLVSLWNEVNARDAAA